MRITQKELDRIRLSFNLDSLIALDLHSIGFPSSFKDYLSLSFRFNKGRGRNGIIWRLESNQFEMILDNNVGALVGDTWLYKLNEDCEIIDKSMLLMR